jgi:hypothetical protein
MKLNIKKFILSSAAAVLLMASSFAQFDGTIEFTKKVGKMEVNYQYHVSGDNIRVEEVNDGNIDGIQIMDLGKGTIYALSPDRKMYMEVQNKRPAATLSVEVEKTGKTKTINGIKCTEIIVTSKEKDRKIVYWIATGDYSFFSPMLTTLNRKENQSMFFLQIPGMEKSFPMHSIEYTLSTGSVVSELVTNKITKGKVDASKFKVPADYTKFEK